ncbi:MAG: phosphoribosyltransferase [Thermoproteota archaeon]|nr:phosphoribosyltransferase [Thermoproteota archaeon]
MKKEEFYVLKWSVFYKDIVRLYKKIKGDNYKPDIIVAIARGGWVVGRIISDLLEVNQVTDLHITFYTNVYSTLKEPIILEGIGKDIKNKKILVVDDVSDTGESLIKAIDYLRSFNPLIIKTATVYIKPWTKFIPDYYIKSIDKWIIYPYEVKETIEKLKNKWLNENKSSEWIENKLIEIGIPKWQVKEFLK